MTNIYPWSIFNQQFLFRDYKSGDLLHIGLTDYQGTVHEFDENGFCDSKTSEWNECLAINISNFSDTELLNHHLIRSRETQLWTSSMYNEATNNCYDYVIWVLNQAILTGHWTKTSLSEHKISPFINKYLNAWCSIYRKVELEGVHISTEVN